MLMLDLAELGELHTEPQSDLRSEQQQSPMQTPSVPSINSSRSSKGNRLLGKLAQLHSRQSEHVDLSQQGKLPRDY